MSKETIAFATSDYSVPKLNQKRSYRQNWLDGDLIIGELVDFNTDSFAWLRLSQTKEGKTNWANAICYDFGRGIQFYYDYNFIKEGLPHYYGEDPYLPYQAVLSFSSCGENEEGRITSSVKYGVFYYDKEGILRTIKSEQISSGSFQHNIPFVNFRQRACGMWSVFAINDLQYPVFYYMERGKPVERAGTVLANGQEAEFSGVVYSLHEENGRTRLIQRSLSGHKSKVIDIPSQIDLLRWIQLLGRQNTEWVKAFSEFPSSIEVAK